MEDNFIRFQRSLRQRSTVHAPFAPSIAIPFKFTLSFHSFNIIVLSTTYVCVSKNSNTVWIIFLDIYENLIAEALLDSLEFIGVRNKKKSLEIRDL